MSIDARPPGRLLRFRPGNPVAITFTWPNDDRPAGTWTANLSGRPLVVSLPTAQSVKVEADSVATASFMGRPRFDLLLGSTVMYTSTWEASLDPAPGSQIFATSVTVGAITADVTMLGGSGVTEVTQAELDAAVAALVAVDVSLDGRLDVVEPLVGTHTTQITALQAVDVTLDGRLDTIEPTVATHTTQISALQVVDGTHNLRLNVAEGDIIDLESDVGDLQATDITLDGRLDAIEPTVATHTTQIANLVSADTALDARLDTAESDINALEAVDVTLDTRLDTAETDINNLEAADVVLDGRLDTIEPTVATHTSQIGALQAVDVTLDTRLDAAEVDIIALEAADVALDAAHDAHVADRTQHVGQVETLEHISAIRRWRQKLAVARNAGGLSVQIIVIGDSISEGFTTTRYRNRWLDRLRRRFMGTTPGTLGLLPASAGVFSTVVDADWAGGDNPWTYAGGVTGNINFGLGFHAANVPSAGGSATLAYFGDKIAIIYARTTTGPTACAVTLDGVAQSTFNANGATLPGQQAVYGTNGSYGLHTIVITPNDGTLVLEGVEWFDGDAPFFVNNSVVLLDGTHAGFGAQSYAGANNDWSGLLAGSDTFCGMCVIALGVNDIALGRTPAQLQADLVTIMQRVDARLGSSDMGYLLVVTPGLTNLTYRDAIRAAAVQFGVTRCSVYDMAALRLDRLFGGDLEDDGVHPNDAGQIWIAEALGQVLDPTPASLSPVTPTQIIIEASQPATFRSSWTESFGQTTSGWGRDLSGAGTTVGERRHRVWLDAGTYRATVTMEEDTTLGTVEVLIGRWNGNTQQLTSCGSKANAAAVPTIVTTRLGTSVATHVAGWHPIVIRKTSATGAIRFVKLVIDKTA